MGETAASGKGLQAPRQGSGLGCAGIMGGVFADDMVAAIIVTILLVPQSLAYALLAGLPPQVGIYVSIFLWWPMHYLGRLVF